MLGHCPHCAELVDTLINSDTSDPVAAEPGDLVVCVFCANVSQIDARLELIPAEIRGPVPEELQAAVNEVRSRNRHRLN